jgi:hypothetical protein
LFLRIPNLKPLETELKRGFETANGGIAHPSSEDYGDRSFVKFANRMKLVGEPVPVDIRASASLGARLGNLHGGSLLALDFLVDLLAVDGNVRRRFDSETNTVAANVYDRHDNVVSNIDTLILVS